MRSKQLLALFFLSLFTQFKVYSQDDRRYLALSLVNVDYRNPHLDDINKAADLGMNAFIMTIAKDVIINKKVSTTNPWEQYDNQINLARSRGMKIGIRISLVTWCNNKTLGNPLDNNVGSCDGFDVSERMQGYSSKGEKRVHQQSVGYEGCDKIDDCGSVLMTSLSAAQTVTNMQDFTRQVLQHYQYLVNSGELLYVSVVMTPEQEFGYPFYTTKGLDGIFEALFDYSPSMITGFRNWLKVKYNNNFVALQNVWGSYAKSFTAFDNVEPPKPSGGFFNWSVFLLGPAGNEWYLYRHKVLKDFSQTFINTVKTFDSRIKVINDYGSLNDIPTLRRGTFAFGDLGENTDGIKMNSAPTQDHRFIMDLARSNVKGKWIMMEVEAYKTETVLQEQQFMEAFTHGAKLVGAFSFDLNNETQRNMLARVANTYIKGNQAVQKVETCGTSVSSVYQLLEDGGCAYSSRDNYQNDCRSYKAWADLRKANGNKPINLVMDESFVNGKPFKLTPADISVCGGNSNFKDFYTTDCAKINTKQVAANTYKGMIETVDCQHISGWALNTQNLDEIPLVDIYIDSIKIGTTQANVGNRPDLVTLFATPKVNFRSFTFALPDSAWYKSGQLKNVYARFANTATLLDDNKETKYLVCEGRGSGICGAKYRLIVSPDSLGNVLTQGGEYKISVSTNTKWKVSKNVSWFTTSVDTSSFNGVFSLKIAANSDTGTRKGRLMITAGDLVKYVTVIQKGVGQPYLRVSPDSITTISFVGAEYRLVVESNVKIKLSKNVNWIVTDPVENVEFGSFGLRIETNPDTITRKGLLILTGMGIKKVFYIIQKGKGQACRECNIPIDTDKPYESSNPNDILVGRVAPNTYRGLVETVNCCAVQGWAFDTQNYDENLAVDIYLDKLKIGSTIANRGYRNDLALTYQSDKLHYKAFCFTVPKSTLDSFANGKDKQLYVRFGGTITKLLANSEKFLNCKPNTVCPFGESCEESYYRNYIETVAPNPSSGKFSLSVYSLMKQKGTIKLVNNQGFLLKTVDTDLEHGMNYLELDAEDVSDGALLMSLTLEDGSILFRRLIKIR